MKWEKLPMEEVKRRNWERYSEYRKERRAKMLLGCLFILSIVFLSIKAVRWIIS